jgi:NitT/TauT family transport system permease protein
MPTPDLLPTRGGPATPTAATIGAATSGEPLEREDTAAVGAGLDALEQQAPGKTPWWIRARRSVLPPLIAIGVLVGIWQLVFNAGIKRPDVLPSPAMVWDAFAGMVADGSVWSVIWTSLHRGVIGFVMAIVLGTALGLAIARIRWLRAAIGPLLTGLQSLPSIAWVPAAVIWFGLSDAAIYSVVLLGAVPSIANGLVAGVDHVPPQFLRVGRVLGLGTIGQIRYVLLPAALPGYLSGLRQGWAFAWRSLMAAELIVTSSKLGFGLGQLLNQGRDLSDMPTVLAAIILIFLVGVGIELTVFRPAERHLLRSRGLGPASA